MKLKKLLLIVFIVLLLAIVGGETFYIVKTKGVVKELNYQLIQSKSSLNQAKTILKEKEEENKTVLFGNENVITNNEETDEESKESTNQKFSMENVCGMYEAKVKFREDDVNQDDTAFYDLQLCSNGTYHYGHTIYAEAGEYGNYYIDSNGDIILNRLFRHASDVGLRICKEKKTHKLTINEDGSLTDKNKILEGGNLDDLSNITLQKVSDTVSDEYYDLNTKLWMLSNLGEGYIYASSD